MSKPRRHAPEQLGASFTAILDGLHIEREFSPEVESLATTRAKSGPLASAGQFADRTDLVLCSIDPEGSRDLDQALAISRVGSGFLFNYAIADLGAWIEPGDAIDLAIQSRGATVYCPDQRVPLHPTSLSEGAASLLEGQVRPALLWSIRLDGRGEITDIDIERAMVRNSRQLSYNEVQAALDSGSTDTTFRLIEEVGVLRKEREIARGGVSLALPEQIVDQTPSGFELRYDRSLAIENHNAQLSLCCGMAAAEVMTSVGFGVLRTLPKPEPQTLEQLRRSSLALGVDWPNDMGYPEWTRTLDPATSKGAALLTQAARTLRGADYLCFEGDLPEEHQHHAIAAPYAHVTAPLRRLVDRYGNECVLAAKHNQSIPDWVHAEFEHLPDTMRAASQLASKVERGIIDLVESAVLLNQLGEEFDATITAVGQRFSVIQLIDPAVVATVEGSRKLGEHIRVKLVEVKLNPPILRFESAM